jgi:hypothetical protein
VTASKFSGPPERKEVDIEALKKTGLKAKGFMEFGRRKI